MHIAILTAYDANFREVGEITSRRNFDYAMKWGYSYISHHAGMEKRMQWYRQSRTHLGPGDNWYPNPVWDKILLADRYIRDYDYIMWIDADAMFMNFAVSISSLIMDPEADLIIANDCNGLNTGVFLVRNSDAGISLLEQVWAMRWQVPNRTEAEQTAMKIALGLEESDFDRAVYIAPRISYLPQRRLNSYLSHLYNRPETEEETYRDGDFIVHLPACNKETRVRVLSEMARR